MPFGNQVITFLFFEARNLRFLTQNLRGLLRQFGAADDQAVVNLTLNPSPQAERDFKSDRFPLAACGEGNALAKQGKGVRFNR